MYTHIHTYVVLYPPPLHLPFLPDGAPRCPKTRASSSWASEDPRGRIVLCIYNVLHHYIISYDVILYHIILCNILYDMSQVARAPPAPARPPLGGLRRGSAPCHPTIGYGVSGINWFVKVNLPLCTHVRGPGYTVPGPRTLGFGRSPPLLLWKRRHVCMNICTCI